MRWQQALHRQTATLACKGLLGWPCRHVALLEWACCQTSKVATTRRLALRVACVAPGSSAGSAGKGEERRTRVRSAAAEVPLSRAYFRHPQLRLRNEGHRTCLGRGRYRQSLGCQRTAQGPWPKASTRRRSDPFEAA